MKKLIRNNGLSLVMLGLFMVFIIGQAITGFFEHNEDKALHGQQAISFQAYLGTGHFLEGVFENWESEFLQMGLYVLLTAFLYQKGSAESNDPDHPDELDPHIRPNSPYPARKGGALLKWYEHSLSVVLLGLFFLSFIGHWFSGSAHNNAERLEHSQEPLPLFAYLASSRFWYESFQNWQSEFLAVFSIVVLSIWLREKHSPESKPVAVPHGKTGK